MRYLGAFAHLLHIRPWEVRELDVDEFDRLAAWIDRAVKPDEEG